ncbi:hypothetical protein [Amycolatopsis sp. NPDC051903]|uniref:hypothetical protein n=1 Tax=Amycolatopsis sp. NPDC051903 TaxID=3363936 RepID=UPI003792A22F
MHEGVVVPTHIVLSHSEQLDRLRRSCPPAADRAVVAGDPCLDRLRDSFSLREAYRQSFGVRTGQKVVFVSSTWGPDSLYGQEPGLPARIARNLPIDEFVVLLALHPNIRQGHFPWQLRMWLEDSRRSGIGVLPREDLWQQAAIAADVTIGDHGSVTFYSACLGTPVLLATAPHEAVDAASPIAALLRAAPRLGDGDLAEQLTATLNRPAPLQAVTDLATSVPGGSATRLLTLGYRTLRLSLPDPAPTLPDFPLPGFVRGEPSATWVTVIGEQIVRRAANSPVALAEGHLVVTTDSPDPRLLERASVVLGSRTADPLRWIVATLRSLPGCQWAACPDAFGWLAGSSTGTLVRYTTPELPQVVPSLLHALEPDLPKRFTTGVTTHEVEVELLLDQRP